jgi:hypothetical protein
VLIPNSKKRLLRKYEATLFYREDFPEEDRLYSFYLLLRPALGWLVPDLKACGLNSDEVESELFLFIAGLFQRFDNTKSSIIPYLEKQIPWKTRDLLQTLRKNILPETPSGWCRVDEPYEMNEEFYWRSPGILFEDRYVGKCFTRSEKYIINIILTADDSDLSQQRLADAGKIDRRKVKEILSEVGEIIQSEEVNA